jgi:hypothetical protein
MSLNGVGCPTMKFQNSVSTSAVGHCNLYQTTNLPVTQPSPPAAKNSAHLFKLLVAFALVRNSGIIPFTEKHECRAVELGHKADRIRDHFSTVHSQFRYTG